MRHLKLVIASSLWGTMLLAAPAFADIPPDDACNQADAGKACNNAGDNADQPGTCQKDTCTRATPDGPMTYDCYLCKPDTPGAGGIGGAGPSPISPSAGAGAAEPMSEAGAPAEGGAKAEGGSKTDGGTNAAGGTKSSGGTSSSPKDDGGCTLVSAPASSLAGLLAPLAAFGFALARRRARRG